MISLVLMAAAVSNAPVGTAARILHFNKTLSYPRGEKFDGAVRTLLTITPRGKVLHCDIVVSSESPKVDDAVCAMMMSGLAVPAKDVAGQQTYGTVGQAVVILNPKRTTTPKSADLSLAVNHMPPGAPTPMSVKATLALDAHGTVTGCYNPAAGSGANGPLGTATCEMALHRLTFKPALDEAGVPVASIRDFVVEYSAPDAPGVNAGKGSPPKPG